MAVEIFNVNWTKLLRLDKALSLSVSQEGGVYLVFKQIGSNYKLQYIGMSKDFHKRFDIHRNNASHFTSENDMKKLFVSFGLITAFETSRMTQDISTEQLRQLESFLINEIKPINNDDSTKKGYKGHPIIVLNNGLAGFFKKKQMSSCPELVKFLKSKL